MDQHKKRVADLSEQVKSFYEQKKPFKIVSPCICQKGFLNTLFGLSKLRVEP